MSPLRWSLPLLLLTGCPYLGDTGYTERVRDVDGDGLIAERFGGPDCDDTDPNLGDCDADQDGVRSVAAGGDDCDDNNASIYPGAPELCDGLDHDCDGLIGNDDEDVSDTAPFVYPDEDGDGFGRDGGAIRWCGTPPGGYVTELELGDCDDADDTKFPGADERCDATDWNCDGDPLANAIDAVAWWVDDDGDGFGDGDTLAVQCNPPSSDAVVRDDTARDCVTDDATVFPGADEVPYDGIDQDCDGSDLTDVDQDGFPGGPQGVDCDDTSPLISPAQDETCNGLDDDCDGAVDDGVLITFYPDYDGDTHGDPTGLVVQACAAPAQHVTTASDCDDTTADRAPDNTEVCDGIDNDCDGDVDSTALDRVVRFPDVDGDTFGDALARWEGCLADLPADIVWLEDDQDCDDTNDRVHPGAAEVCDLLDNDCNGDVDDEADDAILAYIDADDDRFGDPSRPIMLCSVEEGASTLPTDCDDSDPDSYPGAPEICFDNQRQDCSGAAVDDCDADGTPDAQDCGPEDPTRSLTAEEICDGIDNDCDGDIDSDDANVNPATAQQWYLDADGDGITGGVLVGSVQCDPPTNGVALTDDLDCDDGDPGRYPFADERCDDVDNDCDGAVDEEAVDPFPWYDDLDADGFGAFGAEPTLRQCDDPGLGYAGTNDDCVDGQPGVNPGAVEICDGIDNDCDGLVDDLDDDTQLLTWFLDADGDGAGTGAAVLACVPPADHVATDGDCDDADPERRPGAVEQCDGFDNDCDGLTDFDDSDIADTIQWLPDSDGDGVVTWTPDNDDPTQPRDADDDGVWDEAIVSCVQPAGYELVIQDGDSFLNDCNDLAPEVYPGALEVCDGIDNDCVDGADQGDRLIGPTWFADTDGDGWGDPTRTTRACDQPLDHVVLAGDCDDDPDAGGSTVFPGAVEDCTDGFDNDCDGLVDDADLDAAETIWYYDADGDGYGDPITASDPQCSPPDSPPMAGIWVTRGEDCDDTRIDVGPGRVELCDGIDNDCDGIADDEDDDVQAPVRFVDADGDGYGSAPVLACTTSDGIVDEPGDCNDGNPLINPGAPEICTDDGGQPVDEDCDGTADQNVAPVFLDRDGDGYGDPTEQRVDCNDGALLDWVVDATDCNDDDPLVNPGMVERCNDDIQVDDDCDGLLGLSDPDLDVATVRTYVPDIDRDGHYAMDSEVMACEPPSTSWSLDDATLAIDDCDDLAANRYPGAEEICDGVDNDCNTTPDDVAPAARYRWFADSDTDGFADDAASPEYLCDEEPLGYARVRGDCDDGNPTKHPGAPEVCDGDDNDCDELTDAADPGLQGGIAGFIDVDLDNHGDPSRPIQYCAISPIGFADVGDDCDDTLATRSPSLEEICGDGLDNDCSGFEDDDPEGGEVYVRDRDGDAVWDLTLEVRACDDPDGGSDDEWVDLATALLFSTVTDCNDQDPSVHPGAPEICDGIRNDCTDDDADLNPTDGVAYYPDDDDDLFGDREAPPIYACAPPADHVLDNTDCDDTAPNVRPGFPIEFCGNGIDDNCDDIQDDLGLAQVLLSDANDTDYYLYGLDPAVNLDVDGDGYIDEAYRRSDLTRGQSCDPSVVPWFHARQFGDCDDSPGAGHIYPNAPEVCDGDDNDCDGLVDADDGNVDFQGNSVDVHVDADRDGARGNQIVDQTCPGAEVPVGFVLYDGAVDPDCDDSDDDRSPLLMEVCDGIDNNCDSTDNDDEVDVDGDGFLACDPDECDDGNDLLTPVTLWYYPDLDRDGFVETFSDVVVSCDPPADSPEAWAYQVGDCDDADGTSFPGAPELCDGNDNDCDGFVASFEADGDGDGESACTDCDDTDPERSFLLPEICDGIDNNCDDFVDPDLEEDNDGDGYVECDDWVGPASLQGGDCNDAAGVLFPGQTVLASDIIGSAQFDEVQLAIDAVCDHALIQISYPEGPASAFVLPTDKVVEIRGVGGFTSRVDSGGATAIIADGTPAGTVLQNIEANTDDDYGLIVRNGAILDAIDFEVTPNGGSDKGILVQDAGTDLQCTNCEIANTVSDSGSAVYVDGATATFFGAIIRDATNTTNGAVHAVNGSVLTFEDSTFMDNAISGTNVKASALTMDGGLLTLKDTVFEFNTSTDKQPALLINDDADADIEDVKLTDNGGGIWIQTNGTVDMTRVTLIRNGGDDNSSNLEGAIEIRGATDLTVTNALVADNVGPGINIRTSADVSVAYSTFVGNGHAGVAHASGVDVDFTVFADHPVGDIDGPATSSLPNTPVSNWYQYATSESDHCAPSVPSTCFVGDPEFITFHPLIPSDRWLLRPRFNGPTLWNGAGNIFSVGDPDVIIGHAGGPEGDALTWYADTEAGGSGDSLPDGWELHWYGNLTTDDGTAIDVDGDGAFGSAEFIAGSVPTESDTDLDGEDDGCELSSLPPTDPVDPDDISFQCQGGQ